MVTTRADAVIHTRGSRRAALGGIVSAGLAVLLGRAGTRAAAPPRRRFKVITRTFTNATPVLTPNDAGPAVPYPATIRVSGFKQGAILDLNVTFRQFSHNHPADIDFLLQSPGNPGRRAVIMSDVGGSNGFSEVDDLVLGLDDQAVASLPAGPDLISGSFKPTNLDDGSVDFFPAPAQVGSRNVALATFRGLNPNGVWKLFAVDEENDGGRLEAGWSLQIRARVRI